MPYDVLSFPVKSSSKRNPKPEDLVHHMRDKITGDWAPGWALMASLPHIEQSCQELLWEANDRGYRRVMVPRPGCGAGELSWETVRPVLEKHLDERFWVVSR